MTLPIAVIAGRHNPTLLSSEPLLSGRDGSLQKLTFSVSTDEYGTFLGKNSLKQVRVNFWGTRTVVRLGKQQDLDSLIQQNVVLVNEKAKEKISPLKVSDLDGGLKENFIELDRVNRVSENILKNSSFIFRNIVKLFQLFRQRVFHKYYAETDFGSSDKGYGFRDILMLIRALKKT